MRKYLKSYTITVIIPIILFWLFYYFSGHPRPHIDDLFFTGAAINIVKNGEFVNPYIIQWATPVVDRFYVQPPFHTVTLAGWLKIWGISTQSLLLFQCVCYITFSIFTALVLRVYGFPRITAICTTICFAAWMTIVGLRQDALSMAYLAIGIWLLTKDSKIRYLLGFSFLGASILSSLVTVVYAVPFSVAVMTGNLLSQKNSARHKYITERLWILLAAILVVFSLFLISINFELHRFISDLLWHASWRRSSIKINNLITVVTHGYREITDLPLYVFYFLLAAFTAVKIKHVPKKLKIATATITITLILNMLFYERTIFENFSFFCWLGIVLTISKIPVRNKTRIIIAIIAIIIFMLNQSWNLIATIGRQASVPEFHYEQVRQFIKENPDKKYVIDHSAARFVFDYHLPKNAIDWNFSRTYGPFSHPVSIKEKHSDEVWLISPARGFSVEGLPDYPRVKLFGRKLDSIPSQPHDVMIVD